MSLLITFLLVPQKCLSEGSQYDGASGRDRLIEYLRQNPEVIDQADKIRSSILPLVSKLPQKPSFLRKRLAYHLANKTGDRQHDIARPGQGVITNPPDVINTLPGNGPPGNGNGPPGNGNGPPGNVNGPPGNGNGPPGNVNGPPGIDNGPPGNGNGPGGGGPPGIDNGLPGNGHGPGGGGPPGLQPPVPTHPIVLPPEQPPVPTHPIVLPPEQPPEPTHPIVLPPEQPPVPAHPIVLPPEQPSAVAPESEMQSQKATLPRAESQKLKVLPRPDEKNQTNSQEAQQPVVQTQQPVSLTQQSVGLTQQSLPLAQPTASADGIQQVDTLSTNKNTNGKGRNPAYLETRVSITSGRKFVPDAYWNLWMDVNYYDLTDQRYGLDLDGNSTVCILGIDKKMSKNLVTGIMAYAQNFKTTNLGGNWDSKTNGWAIGPYFGYQLSNWAINLDLVFGHTSNNNSLGVLNGNYQSNSYSGQLEARGQYTLGNINILPKSSVFYSSINNQAYQMSGMFIGANLNIPVASANFAVGILDFVLEFNRNFELTYFKTLEPYIEAGVQYEFERPNNGQIMTGNLLLVSTTPWNGTMRLGARLLITESLFLEGSAGYLSIGHPNLNIWEAKLYLSYSF